VGCEELRDGGGVPITPVPRETGFSDDGYVSGVRAGRCSRQGGSERDRGHGHCGVLPNHLRGVWLRFAATTALRVVAVKGRWGPFVWSRALRWWTHHLGRPGAPRMAAR
jgi:hypothetical protein